MCLLPAARTSHSPTPSLGAGVPAKHLEWGGLEVGRARVQRVGGHPALPRLFHRLALPSSHLFPLETEDLLFSIIYNLRLGPPFFLPIE